MNQYVNPVFREFQIIILHTSYFTLSKAFCFLINILALCLFFYLAGVFASSHLEYEHERDNGPEGTPSISEMVETAIKVLRNNDKGYFLMVSYHVKIKGIGVISYGRV